MEHIHTHGTPDGQEVEHKHERGEEVHHHGWHRVPQINPGSTSTMTWIAADQGHYFDDVTDSYGEKRRHTPDVIGQQRVFEIPVVLVMTGFDNEYDAAQEACSQMTNIDTGQDPVDCWTMPANVDITGEDNRAGTIVYGSDNRLIVKALEHVIKTQPGVLDQEEQERLPVLVEYLSRYFFNGA